MTLYAAFDISATTTVICMVAGRDGSPVFDTSAPTDPVVLHAALAPYLCWACSGDGADVQGADRRSDRHDPRALDEAGSVKFGHP